MITMRTIAVGLLAAVALIASPLVATAAANVSPSTSVSDNVVPMGPSDFPWGCC